VVSADMVPAPCRCVQTNVPGDLRDQFEIWHSSGLLPNLLFLLPYIADYTRLRYVEPRGSHESLIGSHSNRSLQEHYYAVGAKKQTPRMSAYLDVNQPHGVMWALTRIRLDHNGTMNYLSCRTGPGQRRWRQQPRWTDVEYPVNAGAEPGLVACLVFEAVGAVAKL
jgi:hypothetical protein